MKYKAIVIIGAITVAVILGFGLWTITLPTPLAFQGQVEAREVDVAAKIAGRIGKVLVREGDSVSAGDVLLEIDSPELTAKMAQASSGKDMALAMSDKADSGAREEEIRMAKFAWTRAQSAAQLAQKSFERFDALFKEGLIAAQKHDEAQTAAIAANDAANAAKAQYDMSVNGAREQDKAAALAGVRQAEGVVQEVSAFVAETRITAPISGEVSQMLVDIGELAPTGFPLITLVDLRDSWVVLNVREDHLVNFKMNAKLGGTLPALGNQQISLEVYYISPQADFATWRATRYSSGYDVKTFEVRLRPNEQIDGMRPGMSVLLALE